jgi:hypothetical protein
MPLAYQRAEQNVHEAIDRELRRLLDAIAVLRDRDKCRGTLYDDIHEQIDRLLSLRQQTGPQDTAYNPLKKHRGPP